MAQAAGVYITNLKEVQQVLRKIYPDLVPVLRTELESAVETTLLPRIIGRIPVGPDKGGHIRSTVKARAQGNAVYIQAGGASKRSGYYGWLDFGGVLRPSGRRRNTQHRPVMKRGRYIYPVVDQSEALLAAAAGRAVAKVNPTK